MGSVANLASRFVLSVGVGVGYGLGKEKNDEKRQGKSEHPDQLMPYLVISNHLDLQATPMFPLTLGLFPREHPGISISNTITEIGRSKVPIAFAPS